MKHAFLRRLGAMALALVLAASLCAPAWAAPAGIRPEFSTGLIVLSSANSTCDLTVNYPAAVEDKITWTIPAGVTATASDGTSKAGPTTLETKVTMDQSTGMLVGTTVTVSAAFNTNGAEISAMVMRDGTDVGRHPRCYVYCGTAPYTVNPSLVELPNGRKSLPNMTAGQSVTLTITFFNGVSVSASDITLESSDNSIATIAPLSGTGNILRTTITAKSVQSREEISIRMRFNNGSYSEQWDLTVVPSNAQYVQSVTLDRNRYTMAPSETSFQLSATVLPTYGNVNRTLKWESSDTGLLTVDQNGRVTRVLPKTSANGTAVITATATDGSGIFDSCRVTVSETPSAFELNPTTMTLDVDGVNANKTGTITATATGENSDNVTVDWSSRDNSVATVSGNSAGATVTAKKAGTTRITATAVFGSGANRKTLYGYCDVTVVDGKSTLVDSLTLSEATHKMPADGSFTLSVTSFTPASAPVRAVTWSSNRPSVADPVNKTGTSTTVTAKGPGQAVITATAVGGAKAICVVTVSPKAESIRLSFNYDTNSPAGSNHYTYTFRKSGNDYISVTAILAPEDRNNPADDPIHWVSKNPSIATVSGGTGTRATVTAAAPGETTITAVPMDPAGKDRSTVDPAEIKVTVSGVSIAKTDGSSTQTITSLTLAEGRRQAVTAQTFGAAAASSSSCEWSSSDPSIVRVGTKTGGSTTLIGARPGTATITVRSGTFSGACTVTVGEDTAAVITASSPPGSPLQFSTLVSQLRSACTSKTGSSLSYITNLSVASTDQGILHDQHHSSADTGAGVGVQDRYYPGTAPQGQRSMNDLSFVPRNTFSGTAEITFTGWSANNKSFNGTIRVTVNGTGDVMYSSSEGAPVNFVADDFNLYHPNLRSVSFTPPQDSVGTLYYNYTSPSQPGTKVSSGTTYSRTGNPSLDRVSFVPAAGYTGTVRISYKGTDTAGRSFTGVVTITVNGGGDTGGSTADISYTMPEDSWVTFKPADFSAASQSTLGESLSYVRFALPPSSEGTLFYNYRGFGDYDSAVASTTSYYYSGTPSLGGVSFVPTTTTPSQVDIDYTGYTIKGNTFTGTIHLGQGGSSQQGGGMRYTVFTGKSVNFSANSFNAACIAATGASLDYVLFTQMPTVAQGNLRYTRGNSSGTNNLSTSTRCYRSAANSWDVQLSNVFFQASSNYTGTVVLPFTGYDTNGSSFTGQVTIEVTPPSASNITYTGTTASPYRLSVRDVQSACGGALNGTLSYITFTSLPSAAAGRLYSGYSGFRTGTQVNTGTRYYASGSPSIDQLSFVPRGRYSGQAAIGFTATNASGQSVSGRIVLNLTSSGSSGYFSDLSYHTWAAPAVDYLYQNGVTKGVTATAFGPDQQINRCDFVLMLCRAFKFSEAGGYSFADVPADSYFAGAVAAAKQRGIVSGDGANFRPYGKLTRQDAMVMIKNALDAAGWSVNASSAAILNQFSDGASVSGYARTAVSALVQMGAVNGDNGRLLPHNPITRAEAAVILHFVMTM